MLKLLHIKQSQLLVEVWNNQMYMFTAVISLLTQISEQRGE